MLPDNLMSQLATSPPQGSLLPGPTCSAPAQSCSDPAGYIAPQGVTAGHWLAYTACVPIEIDCLLPNVCVPASTAWSGAELQQEDAVAERPHCPLGGFRS